MTDIGSNKMPERNAKKIYQALRAARNVLIVPHQNPDGDALGSACVLIHLLKKWNINHTVFCATDKADNLSFLPHVDRITTNAGIWDNHAFDLIVVVDSSDLTYAGVSKYIEELSPRPTIINIDHHVTNENYGDLNLVIKTAASTTQILYNFFKINNIKIDKHTATCLLTGLITDTDNFTNSATTVSSLTIASDLINRGGNIKLIKDIIFKNKTVNSLKLWGQVFSRLEKHDTHEIVYTYITKKDLKKHKVDMEEAEGIANFMNNLSDGKAALILKEREDGTIKGSFRTTKEDVDVSIIAKKLGGGGHKKAAGFEVKGTIEEALEKVWKAIENK